MVSDDRTMNTALGIPGARAVSEWTPAASGVL